MLGFNSSAQLNTNIKQKNIILENDTVQLDTLSLVPNSIRIYTKSNQLFDSSLYTLNYAEATIIFNRKKLIENNLELSEVKIYYKTFPYLFSKKVQHKNIDRIKADLFYSNNPFTYKIQNTDDDIFKMEGLNKTGSISRGMSFGNNQDVVVNSNLNLQLSGRLSENVDLLMVATDNNIPVQPDGNTQQLQEFDKVFIQVSNKNSKLIAGDFQLKRPESYFMNFYKKAQGLSFSTVLKTDNEKEINKQGLYKTTFNAAVSRGKFARNIINGIESNQGPYRLRGAENELFIIVLSGTEVVYIDGKALERGQENDYVIDYNTSEITFTAKQQITKDKRIIVEFQYSDKNYARSLVHFGNDFEKNKLKAHINLYSEQDSKNQPLQQDLSQEQKQLLSQIGDTLSLAITPSYDSVVFSNSEVLYHKKDTTIGSHTFTNIFKYYLNSDSANYRVTYSNVGQGNGNYKQITSSANGKVFEWVMPDTTTNKLNGNYEPVIQLISPKKKQMLTAGIDYQISKNSSVSIEAAVSNNDINTFSKRNNNDDVGYGLKINYDNLKPLTIADSTKNSLNLITNVNYEYVQQNFSPIERYRLVEFERDWNRLSSVFLSDQHIVGAGIGLTKKELGLLHYRFSAFFEGTNYNATKHYTTFKFAKKGLSVLYDGSILYSESKNQTSFYRHKTGISQKIKWLQFGYRDEFEKNQFKVLNKDSLLSNSYQFWEWQAFIENSDSTKNKYGLLYKQRTDYATKYNLTNSFLNKTAFGESYGGFYQLIKNSNNQLKVNATYRNLQIVDSTLTLQKPDNSLVSRVEYNLRILKGVIYSNSFYEIGSGLEVKKEFSFLEVAPGQGVYTWIDYNGNNVKELNEFEISTFPDQAKYIKVYTPTNNYIKTYSNQFSEVIMLKPSVVWTNKKGIKKFVSRFANQTAYRVERKSTESDLAIAFNPFESKTNDSTLVTLNSSLRNTFFINQMSSIWGLDVTYQDVRNKTLLINGIDSRKNIFKEARLRLNLGQKFSVNTNYKDGIKANASQFFKTRDFYINYFEVEPKLNYQPNTSFRISFSYKHSEKKNQIELGGQKATLQNYGTEIKYNVLQKGSLNFSANYIKIKFDGDQNTSLAFEMLDALKAGQNITWNISYQRNLSNNLQLSLTYDGRKSEGTKTIHVGGAQVRAYF